MDKMFKEAMKALSESTNEVLQDAIIASIDNILDMYNQAKLDMARRYTKKYHPTFIETFDWKIVKDPKGKKKTFVKNRQGFKKAMKKLHEIFNKDPDTIRGVGVFYFPSKDFTIHLTLREDHGVTELPTVINGHDISYAKMHKV